MSSTFARILRCPNFYISAASDICPLAIPRTSVRHASIRAGVARGLRASGVEPASTRTRLRERAGINREPSKPQLSQRENTDGTYAQSAHSRQSVGHARTTSPIKRRKARRGPNTGALGQKKADSKPAPSTAVSARVPSYAPQIGSQGVQKSTIPHPFPVPYSNATSVFVPGRRAVESILLAGRRVVYKVYVAQQSRLSSPVKQLEDIARRKKIAVELTSQDYIDRIMTTLKMNGIVNDGCLVECSDLTYTAIQSLGATGKGDTTFTYMTSQDTRSYPVERDPEGKKWRAPFLLWLHEVVDTRNIAALYRSAIYFGVDAIVLTERGTGRMQSSALRTSAGAAEFLPTLTVANPTDFVKSSKRRGWQFLGAMPPAKDAKSSKKLDINEMDRTPVETKPSVLVLGNEDQGLSKHIKEVCDTAVTIPSAGDRAAKAGVDSLNVGVAGTLLFSRLLQQPTDSPLRRSHKVSENINNTKDRLF